MKRIAIISSAETTTNKDIVHDLAEQLSADLGDGNQVVWCAYDDIAWSIIDGVVEVVHLPTGQLLSDFDYVWFKSFARNQERAVALAHLFKAANVLFDCSELLSSASTGKLTQYAQLNGVVPIPNTVFIPMNHLSSQYQTLTNRFGDKLIIKAADGKGGEANYLVSSQSQLDELVAQHSGEDFVVQPFIPNQEDFRVLIFGATIRLIIRRRRADDSTHLNNTSQGAGAELVWLEALSPEEQTICMQAAKVLGREIAGVDLMRNSQTNAPYILEVNAGPQLGTGAFTDEKRAVLVAYFREKLLQKTGE